MQEFIAQEKARLQSLFEEFNRDGSFIVMREGRGEPLPLGLVDSYTVTRVAPHFDAAGNTTKTDFWVMWKSVGYDNGYQYTHTIKVVEWSREDTYEIDLADDLGRRYHIELIMDATEHACQRPPACAPPMVGSCAPPRMCVSRCSRLLSGGLRDRFLLGVGLLSFGWARGVFAGPLPVAFAGYDGHSGMVCESVEGCGGQERIPEYLRPFGG
jgi:hypothetical protein